MPAARSSLLSLVLAGCRAAGDEVGTSEGSESATTETSEAESGDQSLVAGVEIVLHPNQPMVVDVLVELVAPGFATLAHPDDPGVRVAWLDGEGPSTTVHLRVRGLAPAADHALELAVGATDGRPTEFAPVDVTTNPALPGHVDSFPPTRQIGGAFDPDYRLFDLSEAFVAGNPSVFMIDASGRTRWHYGVAEGFAGLDQIWVGLKQRADGSLLVMRGDAALIVDELGDELMRVEADADLGIHDFHHDVIELPNGNFMALSWSYADIDYGPEGVLHVAGDSIAEFTPNGELVWTWDAFDHLDPQRRREGFFGSFPIVDPETEENGYDWTHANGIVYADGIVYLSLRHQDWVVAIDHATGEIVWRLGEEGDFLLGGGATWFRHQHSPQWQPDGSLLLYDNAVGNPDVPDSQAHSRAVRLELDFDGMTATIAWQDDDDAFFSTLAGDADRTSGGNVLRLDSSVGGVPGSPSVYSRLRELDPDASPNAVWSVDLPLGMYAYRAVPTTRIVGESAR